ncbi:MAG: cytochrome P450 [Pseudomonadota bacterium]
MAAPMLSPGFFEDVFATYAELREKEPVHFIQPIKTWFVSRHVDVKNILADNENFSVENMPITEAWHPDVKHALSSLFMDDPDHARLRGVVANFFMPAQVNKLEGAVQEIVDKAIDGVRQSGKQIIDIEKEFAYTVPIDVLSMIMGLPKQDYVLFHEWAPKLAEALQPMQTDVQKEEGGATARAIGAYLDALFERGNLKPHGDDTVLSLLKDAVDSGVMHEKELLTQAVQLYIGGHETTLSLIGKCIHSLLTHPEELEKFKSDPSIAARVVDETVRFNGVSHVIGRRLVNDYTLHGVTMKANDMVFLGNASANRDESIYSDADKFIVDRKARTPHLGFGRGIRYCLGNHLAKLETRLAITALFDAFPNMQLVAGHEPKFGTNLMLHGLLSLPVELNA